MKELIEQRNQYKQIVETSKNKQQDNAENPMLNDSVLDECLSIAQTEAQTEVKQPKMNVLILGNLI